MGGIVCSGNVRVAYVDADGVPTGGYIGIINAVKLQFTVPDPDVKERISKQNETFGQALDSVSFPKPMELELDTDDLGDAETLGWALGGTPANFTQSAATVTGEVLTAVKGKWIPLANRRVTAVVVTNSGGTTTYVVGTDYLLDAEAGFIKITDAGAITDAQSLKSNYTAPALTGKKVSVGNRPSIQVRLDGDMVNLANGQRIHVVVPKAKLSPSGGLDVMGTDFLQTALKGNALVVGSNAPADFTLIDG
jgi:hypothetical protein